MSLLEWSSLLREKRKAGRGWLTRPSRKPLHHKETVCLCNELEGYVREASVLARSVFKLQDQSLIGQYEKLLNRLALILTMSSDAYRLHLVSNPHCRAGLLVLLQSQRRSLSSLRRQVALKKLGNLLLLFVPDSRGQGYHPLL